MSAYCEILGVNLHVRDGVPIDKARTVIDALRVLKLVVFDNGVIEQDNREVKWDWEIYLDLLDLAEVAEGWMYFRAYETEEEWAVRLCKGRITEYNAVIKYEKVASFKNLKDLLKREYYADDKIILLIVDYDDSVIEKKQLYVCLVDSRTNKVLRAEVKASTLETVYKYISGKINIGHLLRARCWDDWLNKEKIPPDEVIARKLAELGFKKEALVLAL